MLSASCAFVLGVLEQGPVPFSALQDYLQAFAGDADSQEVSGLAQEIVDTLIRMGMIETLEDAS